MVNSHEGEEQEVYELEGEPAVVINGVPALNADLNETAANNTLDFNSNVCPQKNHGFGKALEGRVIRKMFSGQYYYGKVTGFDEETKWYRVDYEDGDFEDLEWHELEELLLPLDVSLSVRQVALNNYRYDKSIFESGEAASSFQDRRPKTLESTKVPGIIQEVAPVIRKRGRPAKKSMHQETPQNIEKRPRGRPPKKIVHQEAPASIEDSWQQETTQNIEKSMHQETLQNIEKRPRGRPPKKIVHPEAPASIEKSWQQETTQNIEKSVHQETPQNIEKRPRGRPPKTIVHPEAPVNIENSWQQETTQNIEKSVHQEIPQSLEKRPRGRPPKKIVHQEAAAEDIENSVHLEAPQIIEKGVHQGTPLNTEKSEHHETSHNIEESVHLETAQNVEKRSRGRPRKQPKLEIRMQGEKSSPEKRSPGRPRKTPQPEIHMRHEISSAEKHLLQAMELPVEVISTEKGSS